MTAAVVLVNKIRQRYKVPMSSRYSGAELPMREDDERPHSKPSFI
jgi:hypothetical protein